jgi:hypothetical protein
VETDAHGLCGDHRQSVGENEPQRGPRIVEHTFAWLSTWRRLAKDYEVLPSSEEAWIYVAMIHIMLGRSVQTQT